MSGTGSGRRCSRAASRSSRSTGSGAPLSGAGSSVGAPAPRGAGGAKPASRSFSRPAGVILSVDHESSSRTSTCGSPPSAVTAASICVRIASSAGQPMNVGVNVDPDAHALDRDVFDDAEVDERDDGDLRIRDLAERLPDTLGAVTIGLTTAPAERTGAPSSSRSRGRRTRPGAVALDRLDLRPADAFRQHRPQLRRRARRARTARAPLPRRARAASSAQPVEPHLGVQAVVDLFALDLRRDPRELVVVVRLQSPRSGSRPRSRRGRAARSSAPSRARGAAGRAARSGTPRACGRTRARRRRSRARAAASS